MRWTWTALLALVAGCDGIRLENVVKQHEARTRVAAEPPGVHCAHGGSAVLSGLDLNDNDVLDDGEVTGTQYACATALTRQVSEPAGTHCPLGGRAVRTGVDVDADGTLDDAEVTATEYLCATAIPDVLVHTQEVPPGDKCPQGGQLSRAGHDTNGNGELEDGEVTREVYGCTQPQTVLTRVRGFEPEPFVCVGMMTSVEAGPDSDRDGELDDGEGRARMDLCMDAGRAVVKRLPEPAGARCPAGGTRVQAGEDVNQDGELGETEVASEIFVCQPLHTYFGDYSVTSAADLAALQGISHIKGHLTILGTALTEVVLPGLSVVEGRVTIDDNNLLTRLELPGLRFVGYSLQVSSHPVLETLVLGGAWGERLWVEGAFTLRSNTQLASTAGLRLVIPNSLVLEDNDALDFVEFREPGFDNIMSLPGELVVSDNATLHALPFPNLRQVGGSVHISGNGGLRYLSGTNLTVIGSGLSVINNDLLEDLSGLSSLKTIAGWFNLGANDSMRTTEGMWALDQMQGFVVRASPQLEWVGDMPALRSIDFQFDIRENPKLLGLRNLGGLLYISQLTLADNPLLTELSPLSRTTRLEDLTVQRSPALTSLGALANLREVLKLNLTENANLTRLDLGALQKVSYEFSVTGNAKLPTCLVTALAEGVYTGTPARRYITNNDDTATCGN